MSTLQTRGTLGDLGKRGLGPEFEQVFEQNLIKYVGREAAAQVFDFKNTEKAVLRTTGLTGLALPSEFEEGDPYPSVAQIKTFETVYSIRDYGSSVEVTEDCLDDRERLGSKLDEMANLAKSADIQEVKAAFQILVSGHNTSATSNGISIHRYNDEALFSASHARADGGSSQSNTSTVTLTETNLETGRLALVKQLTDNGLPILDMGMITLVVPDDLEKNAVIFTDSEQRPSTANNDLNYYRGRIGVLSARWLNSANGGSATAWYLVAKLPKMGSPLCVYRRGGPKYFERPVDSRTGNQIFAMKNRFAVGNTEWKGTWGSTGAG